MAIDRYGDEIRAYFASESYFMTNADISVRDGVVHSGTHLHSVELADMEDADECHIQFTAYDKQGSLARYSISLPVADVREYIVPDKELLAKQAEYHSKLKRRKRIVNALGITCLAMVVAAIALGKAWLNDDTDSILLNIGLHASMLAWFITFLLYMVGIIIDDSFIEQQYKEDVQQIQQS